MKFENKDFVHFHTHSEYSRFDGLAKIDELVFQARKMGFPALALTDHGNIQGWIKFLQQCRVTKDKKGNEIPYAPIKPILGCEFYLSRQMDMGQNVEKRDTDAIKNIQPDGRRGNRHINLYAMNYEGYQNICRLSQASFTDGFYFDPRIDIDFLSKHSRGVMCGSACFVENQYVNTGNGLKKISELSLCDRVLGRDGNYHSINHLTSRDYEGEIYTIKARGNFGNIECTSDHKILIYDKNDKKIKWEEASNVSKNNYLLTSSVKNNVDEGKNLWEYVNFKKSAKSHNLKNISDKFLPISEDLCYLMGWYLAEGGTGNNRKEVTWTLHIEEKEYANKIKNILKSIFDLDSSIVERKDHNRIDVVCCSVELREFFKTFCGIGCENKFIHEVFKSSLREYRLAILRGAFLGDGHYRIEKLKNNKKAKRFAYASISKSLVHDIREICLSFNIIVSAHTYGERIDSKGVCHKRSYYLLAYGDDAESLCELMDCGKINSIGDRIYNKVYKFVGENKEYFAMPIESIEFEKKKTKVYCLNEPLTSSFHANGIIVHNCLSSVINVNLMHGNYNKAKHICGLFNEIFDGNFFLEVMYHGIREESLILPYIFKLSSELNIPVIATNDSHYIRSSQGKSQEVLLCMSQQRCMKDPKRLSFGHQEFFLKSAQQMAEMFGHTPQALYNSVRMAERIDTKDIEQNLFGGMRLPKFEIPEEYKNPYEYLTKLAWEGLKKIGWDSSQPHVDALKMELNDVKVAFDANNYDFSTYFLIVRDYIQYAKNKGIFVGCGRGSGYASVLLRCIGITYGVDPVKHGLLWERFLGFDDKRYIKEDDFGFEVDLIQEAAEKSDIEIDRELEDDLGGVDRY